MKRKSFSLFFALTAFCVVFSCTSDDTAESDTSRRTDVPEGRTKTDTVYVRETVYEHDTVYVPDTIVVEDTEPRILEFQLLASQNPTVLIENVNCEIVGDSLIEGWIPHLTQDKLLIPHFKSVGKVSYNNSPVLSDTTTVDGLMRSRITACGIGLGCADDCEVDWVELDCDVVAGADVVTFEGVCVDCADTAAFSFTF